MELSADYFTSPEGCNVTGVGVRDRWEERDGGPREPETPTES